MKKIATISLNINTDDLNYGALLHSYAFQRFIKRYDSIATEIIDYKGPDIESLNLKYPTLSLIKQKKYYVALMSLLRFFSHARRYEKFKKFIENYCQVSKKCFSQDTLNKEKLSYDVVVCESDVIWSVDITQKGFDKTFFLALDSMNNCKRVAYAASLANGDFSCDQEAEFKNLLKNLNKISVREAYASKYIENLIGQPVDCVVDPVLLLSAEEYGVITNSRLIEEPYVLLYMPIEYNLRTVLKVKKYAQQNKLKVVEISSYPFDIPLHKVIRDAGIEDFLSLIKYANVVFSNSFHAVCFSVIYNKEFFAFSRKTGRKIEDFCDRLGLGDRFVVDSINDCDPIDYNAVNIKMDQLKQQSISYIEDNIIN